MLRRDFKVMKMKKSETIADYFNRVTTVSNRLHKNGEKIPKVKIVEKILRTLNDKFTYIVVSIEKSNDIETMTVDELQSTLTMHEQKFNKTKKEDGEQVLKVEERFSTLSVRGRENAAYRGRSAGRGKGRQSYNKRNVECFNCHKMGHFQYECPTSSKEVHYVEVDEDEELLLMAHVETVEDERKNT
ncbi:hypothetical protein LIER_32713 [Lithospermum erythrorhizon]|uniref:CCHC-type domain-containing protein n=1 Tax=Lithospermum erythrorhizon TaxID=34254 RepID=A0AAV3RX49_LITER